MIIEITEAAHEIRTGTTATYPTNFLKLVLEADGKKLPLWRRILRWLKRIK